MEQTFTSEFGGRFTVGQGPGRDGTRGNKDARGEHHLCQLWISCLRAETWDVSNLGRRRTRRAARGGGGRRAPREEVAVAFRAKQEIVLVIHPADGLGAPRRARAQLGLGEARAQRRRLRLLLGRLRLRLHLGRFALGGSGRQGLRCRGRVGGLAARQDAVHPRLVHVGRRRRRRRGALRRGARRRRGPRRGLERLDALDPLEDAPRVRQANRRFHHGCVGDRGDVERGRGLQRCRRAHGDQRGAQDVVDYSWVGKVSA